MQKLSSGFKINRAADDASGLSISEKMKIQITAFDKFDENTEDGVSLVQTAEGAMAEVSEMLQRGFELSAKATNGVLDDDKRKTLQHEVDEIVDEIDRISLTTKFNNIQLLRGKIDIQVTQKFVPKEIVMTWKVPTYSTEGLPDWAEVDSESADKKSLANTYIDDDGNEYYATVLDFSNFTADKISDSLGKGFHTTCCTCDNNYSFEFTDQPSSLDEIGRHKAYKVDISQAQSAEDIYDAKEMMAYTTKNVIAEAAQSMLAQANSRPQEILQLLQQ